MPYSPAAARLLGVALALTWAALGLLFLAGVSASPVHAPMALVAFVPAALALWGALRPGPTPSSVWHGLVGLLALTLSLPTVGLLAEPLLSADRAPRAVSPEVVYAGVVSFGLTVAFATRLLTGARRALLLSGSATAVAGLAALVAAISGAPAGLPTGCVVPRSADAALLSVAARAEIDGHAVGRVRLAGERTGGVERWTAALGGTAGEGQVDRPPDADRTLEESVVGLLESRALAAAENLGVERLADGPARRCRLMVDGTMAVAAMPPLAWLFGAEPGDSPPPAAVEWLEVWRGELDWWVGADARLMRADVFIEGHPADPWAVRALRGRLQAQLSVVERTTSGAATDALP